MAAQMCSQAVLAADPGFRSRVYVALVASAVAVAGEAKAAMSDTVYSKRQLLAYAVLTSPQAFTERFAIMAASNGTIGGDVVPPVSITSSTSANPSVVTTAAVHGMATGDTVAVAGHATNTAVNGQWTVTVLTTTTFSVPVAGTAAGTGGTSTKQPPDIDITNFGPFSMWNKAAGVTAVD
jgi:hypothetical protein